MNVLKIGVVEDELIIAGNIIRTLAEIGYHTTEPAVSYSEAIQMLIAEKPDLLLLDINLSGKKDGIDVAEYINEKLKIPFIFLTANSDTATLERAKKVNPNAYLIKPFTKEDLYVSIEVAFNNYNSIRHTPAAPANTGFASSLPRNAVFIRDKQAFVRVPFSDILVVESSGNYLSLYLTGGEKLLHRSTLTDFTDQLPGSLFFRCHRSYIIRIDAIEKIEDGQLYINGVSMPVPIGKDRLDELMALLGIHL